MCWYCFLFAIGCKYQNYILLWIVLGIIVNAKNNIYIMAHTLRHKSQYTHTNWRGFLLQLLKYMMY